MSTKRPTKKSPAEAGEGNSRADEAADDSNDDREKPDLEAEAAELRVRYEALLEKMEPGASDSNETALETQLRVIKARLGDLLGEVAEEYPNHACEIRDQVNLAFKLMRKNQDEVFETVLEWAYLECNLRSIEPKEKALHAARSRVMNDPRSLAMAEIRTEWEKRGRPGASFAREMHVKHAGVILSESSIKNAITRWRKSSS